MQLILLILLNCVIKMAFDNLYPNRKDWRKRFYKSNAIDRSCRCHGTCAYCISNRMYRSNKNDIAIKEQLKEIQ